jgi:hypothetical protein
VRLPAGGAPQFARGNSAITLEEGQNLLGLAALPGGRSFALLLACVAFAGGLVGEFRNR